MRTFTAGRGQKTKKILWSVLFLLPLFGVPVAHSLVAHEPLTFGDFIGGNLVFLYLTISWAFEPRLVAVSMDEEKKELIVRSKKLFSPAYTRSVPMEQLTVRLSRHRRTFGLLEPLSIRFLRNRKSMLVLSGSSGFSMDELEEIARLSEAYAQQPSKPYLIS